jgi:hypothetical protein
MKIWDIKKIREQISRRLPEGRVVPRHTKEGHFYEVLDGDLNISPPPIYPSVTGKLQILKDEGLMNYKMNQAIKYVFAHYSSFNDSNVMEHLDAASRVSQDILEDAGDIGTRVHNIRQTIFEQWIKTGKKPTNYPSFIPEVEYDIRAVSALRALEQFVNDYDYRPVATEMLVYNHEYEVAGTLDDIGLIKQVLNEGDPKCGHQHRVWNPKTGKWTCMACGYQYRDQLILLDLKTSNQFKDHYFFQVAMYWWMFWHLMGIDFKPEKCFILKVSKEDGRYKIEDLKMPARLAGYAKHMLRTKEGMEFIRELRKDNQRNVVKI